MKHHSVLGAVLAGAVFIMLAPIPAAADFPVSQAKNWEKETTIAYNSTDHEYLVVWSEAIPAGGGNYLLLGSVRAQRVAEDGGMLGNPFTVFSTALAPTVSYNSAANEYLVGAVAFGETRVQRVSNSGALTGNPVPVMTNAVYIRLLYNSLAGNFLLLGAVWEETAPGSGTYGTKIYSRKLASDGQPLSGSALVESNAGDTYFAAAYAPISSPETPTGRYLLAVGGLMCTMLDSDGLPIDVVTDPYHPGQKYRYVPFSQGRLGGVHSFDMTFGTEGGYGVAGPAFLLVWADENNLYQNTLWPGIWATFIDATKLDYTTEFVVQDHTFLVSWIYAHWARSPEVESWKPRVAFNPGAEKYMIAWRETPGPEELNDTKVVHIRANTAFDKMPPKENVVLSRTNGDEIPRAPAIASSTYGGSGLVVWEDHRDSVATDWDLFGSVYKIADVTPPPPPPPTTTWVVTNTNDQGTGSLRQAILNANTRTGMDTIVFNIPGTGLHTIQPLSALPPVTDPVLIDGYTQPGSSPNTTPFPGALNTVLTIELNGTNAGNSAIGLRLSAGNTKVRGLVINNFQSPAAGAIVISGSGGDAIEGNFVGTDASGKTKLKNGFGVHIDGVPDNRVGGTTAAARNLISGNTQWGVWIENSGATGNQVQGNLIGSDITGTTPLGNMAGISITGITGENGNLIGGRTPGAPNLISGNLEAGILISMGSSENRIEGNWIGTQSDGSSPLGNGEAGIQIFNRAHNNTIGGTADGAGNIIAHNYSGGVFLVQDTAGGNRVSSNSIYDNKRVGIDLQGGSESPSGVTTNDPGDIDVGPNGLQNFPVLTFVMGGDYLSCQGTLNSKPGTSYRLEFFATDQDKTPTGRDGQTYLGWTELTTDGNGDASFDATIGTPMPVGRSITATAIDPQGNTSEFSAPLLVTLVPGAEVVTNTLDQGPGSLRQAILNANAKPGRDTIAFSIPGAGPHTIMPAAPLPAPTEAVVIDGYTQPGSKVNTNDLKGPCNAVLKIILDGSAIDNLQPPPDGLRISGGGSILRGLVINAFAGSGVVLDTKGGNHIEGTYIGTDNLGLSRYGNTNGVFIDSVGYNYVGGTIPESRNIISGNKEAGIVARAHASRGNRIQGNYIGLDATGAGGLGNLWAGIDLRGAPSNTVGGIAAEAGNVIGGGDNSTNLAFSSACGIAIAGAGGNTIQGNLIGTNAMGTDSLPNQQTGIDIYPDAPGNIIGGASPGARNVISGNAHNGIVLLSDSNTVQGNYIGTDITGAKEVHNGYNGIHVGACSNIVGGRTPSAGNVISGNNDAGIYIVGHSTGTGYLTVSNNRVEGNRIGTRADGASPLGNKLCGVRVMEGTEDNMIGDTALAAGNIIAFNHLDGVNIGTTTIPSTRYPMRTRVYGNSVYGNSRIGINLCGGAEDTCGVTANHPGGPVEGPNGLQNYPVLSAISGGTSLLYQGSLNGHPDTRYRVELFATAKEHTANGRDGETFLGWTEITTDNRGEAVFSGTVGVPVAEGRLITATATDTAGNTSEFSAPVAVGPALSVNGPEGTLPAETALLQNYPNPFNPTTMIRYALPHRSLVKLTVFNTLGQRVAELVNGEVEAGYHLVRFDAGRLASGVYFYRFEAGNFVQTRKMVATH